MKDFSTYTQPLFFDGISELAESIDVRQGKKHNKCYSVTFHFYKNNPKMDGTALIGEFLPLNNERILRHSIIERALLLALILTN